MLRLMLNAHPNIAIPFESDFIPKFYQRLGEYGDLRIPTNIAHLLQDISEQSFVKRGNLVQNPDAILARRPESYGELIAAIYEVYAETQGKRRWGDKDPDYVAQIDVLWNLFANCRIVHIVRDGRAVANSLRRQEWGSSNLLKLARDWSWQVTLAHKMGQMIGARQYMEIRYEDLVNAPQRILEEICSFLDEPFDVQMLDYHKNAKIYMPESSLKYHSSSIRPPDPQKIHAWRDGMSLADQTLFEEVAGHTLESFGYRREARGATWRSHLMKLKYTLIDRW